MNTTEIEKCRSVLQTIEEIDLQAKALEQWTDTNLEEISLGICNAFEFITNLRRTIPQLREALDRDGLFLPLNFTEPETYDGQIPKALQNLRNAINNNSWNEAANYLFYLIRYQMHLGYWDRSKVKLHSDSDIKAVEKLEAIELLQQKSQQESESLKTEHEKLAQLVQAKSKELNEIENLRDSARTNREEIETILKDTTAKQEALKTLVSTQTENKTKIKDSLESISATDLEIQSRLIEIAESHDKAQELQKEIQGKRSEIDRLLGGAADARLGHTFQARSDELKGRVKFWMFCIPLAFLLGVGWFAASFYLIPVPSDNPWVYFFFLTLKLTPSLIIIFWALKQYGRERSFLEEYAFKSAVALTVHAYADELASEEYGLKESDFEEDPTEYRKYLNNRENLRKNLIKETVDRLYQDPRVHKESNTRWMTLRPNAAKDVITEVRNLVKESKNII